MDTNILGTQPIHKLLFKFAVPSVIAMLVNSVYNLVDQIFIGQGVGYLGNAATNVVFPFVTLSMAISLMIAVGSAANVGLNLGRRDQEAADRTLCNGLVLAIIAGVLILVIGEVFMIPLLRLFGATDTVLPLAIEYGRIFLIGAPFTTIGIMLSDEIRADGNPGYTMKSMLLGFVFNCIFDPLFIFVFKWGVAGAALATIMGQLATMIVNVLYLRKFRTLNVRREYFKLHGSTVKGIFTLGTSSFITQVAMLFMQVIMNQQIVRYGAMSIYGTDIPLTVFGIVSKINQLMFSFIMGICIGPQPVFSFNYGAKKYNRVRQLVVYSILACLVIGVIGMIILQTFPQQIISIFGQEDALYNEFAVMCLRNMTILIFVMGVQMVASVYFQAVGKPVYATIIALSRQILFMIPCFLILPHFFGILGIMWAFPVSDVLSVTLSGIMLSVEIRNLNKMMKEPS